jgi:Plant transposon protein
VLYPTYVKMPTTLQDIETHIKEFEAVGLPGCIGSVDATHVGMLRCPFARWNQHKGPKESFPARSYNIIVNHRRQILSSTSGHPSRWNDKTLALHDSILRGVSNNELLSNYRLKLYKKDDNGNIIQVNYKSAWFLCDNGYPEWTCLIPPMKNPIFHQEYRFSEWIESMRKDVECTFGILKGRFRVLKTGIRLHGLAVTDSIWLTCCALHNLFLYEDGLMEEWQNDENIWETPSYGEHDEQDVISNIPTTLLQQFANPSVFDLSGMGAGTDQDWPTDDNNNNRTNNHSRNNNSNIRDSRNNNTNSTDSRNSNSNSSDSKSSDSKSSIDSVASESDNSDNNDVVNDDTNDYYNINNVNDYTMNDIINDVNEDTLNDTFNDTLNVTLNEQTLKEDNTMNDNLIKMNNVNDNENDDVNDNLNGDVNDMDVDDVNDNIHDVNIHDVNDNLNDDLNNILNEVQNDVNVNEVVNNIDNNDNLNHVNENINNVNDNIDINNVEEDINIDNVEEDIDNVEIELSTLTMEEFRDALVVHFDILFDKKDRLVWPSRLGNNNFHYNNILNNRMENQNIS